MTTTPGQSPTDARRQDDVRTARTDPVTAHLGSRTWTDAARLTLFVPVGSLEQHGPHLPLDTDTRVATAVAERLAQAVQACGADAVVAPAIAYGSSGEHQDFPGTISIGREALALLLLEFGRSACSWAERVLFVNAHGGNLDALVDAVTRLRSEGRDAAWMPCAPGPAPLDSSLPNDAHAGRTETSLMALLRPGDVRWDRIEPGTTTSLPDILPKLRAHGVRAVAPNGVLGDPAGANAAEGRALLDAICRAALRRLAAGGVAANGCLGA